MQMYLNIHDFKFFSGAPGHLFQKAEEGMGRGWKTSSPIPGLWKSIGVVNNLLFVFLPETILSTARIMGFR